MSLAIVTAVTPDYMDKLKWTLPSWMIKDQFAQASTLYIFFNGIRKPEKAFKWATEYHPNIKLIDWNMDDAESQRELMISSFVLGAAQVVEEEYFVKLDADAYCVDDQDAFEDEDFKHDLVSHPWGYTKPGWWVNKLEHWVQFKAWDASSEQPGTKKDKRIISWCCLHKADFVKKVASCCGSRMPVPSHDTLLWFMGISPMIKEQ